MSPLASTPYMASTLSYRSHLMTDELKFQPAAFVLDSRAVRVSFRPSDYHLFMTPIWGESIGQDR